MSTRAGSSAPTRTACASARSRRYEGVGVHAGPFSSGSGPVALFGRRQLGEIALDARRELLVLLGADQLQARLPLAPLPLAARVGADELAQRDHSAPITTATARASSTIQGQLTISVYPWKSLGYSAFMARIARLSIAVAAAALADAGTRHAAERTLTFTTAAISVPGYGVAQQPLSAAVARRRRLRRRHGGRGRGCRRQGAGPRQGDAPPHRLRQDRRPRLHVRRLHGALLRRGRGAARALAAARLRLREQGDRPLGAALHADEPQAQAAERLHPLHGALRHGREADAGQAGLARRPQLHGRHRPRLRRPRRRQALLHLHQDRGLHDAQRAAGSSRAAATCTAAASGSSCATRPAARFHSSRGRAGAARSRSRCCTSPARRRCPRSTRPVGIPVAKGQKLRLAAVYDNQAPHTRAMGIMLVWLAPGAVQGCRRDAFAPARSRQSFGAAAVLDAAAARNRRGRSRRRSRPSSATSATGASASR